VLLDNAKIPGCHHIDHIALTASIGPHPSPHMGTWFKHVWPHNLALRFVIHTIPKFGGYVHSVSHPYRLTFRVQRQEESVVRLAVGWGGGEHV
jgi:hypothetical protein